MNIRSLGIFTTAMLALAAAATAYGNEAYANGGSPNGYANNGGNYGSGSDNGYGGGHENGDGHDEENGPAYGNGSHKLNLSGGRTGLFAVLQGGSEVSPQGTANAGDRNGRGTASVLPDPRSGKLCFGITVDNIDNPVAAHIHNAPAGQNGPVVVTLSAPRHGTPGHASGCVHNVDKELLRAILERPSAFYVNVHTGTYPDGAVRGQLF